MHIHRYSSWSKPYDVEVYYYLGRQYVGKSLDPYQEKFCKKCHKRKERKAQ